MVNKYCMSQQKGTAKRARWENRLCNALSPHFPSESGKLASVREMGVCAQRMKASVVIERRSI